MKLFGSFGLDTSNQCLWRDGAQIALSPKPFAVLRHLVENPGRLITHDELLDALWPETFVQPQVLRTYMLELRKVLDDDARQPRFIQTLPKRGYCFVSPVVEGEAPRSIPSLRGGEQPESAPAFVDRDEELAQLNAQARLAAGGRRQVVLLSGEAGIGKTALVDAFCRQVDATSSAVVARGQCVRGFNEAQEYYPVMEALGHLCASPEAEAACRVLARMAPAWLAALGRDPRPNGSLAVPAVSHDRKLADLSAALEQLSAEKPLVLVFEDIHWADTSTLDLVSALARRRTPARLLVLATLRPMEGASWGALKVLRHDLLLRRLCAEIALAPLEKTALKELIGHRLGHDGPPWLTAFVHRHSEGNPLFAIALVDHLIARGFVAIANADGSRPSAPHAPFSGSETGIPDELAQMIELEIETLVPAEQRILEAASLMTVAFPAWAVAAALEQDAGEIEEACDDLSRRLHFVRRAGEDELPDGTRSAFYVFAHELYREALYGRQAAARRAQRHIRIAQRLGELFEGRVADVAREMSMHYEAAGDWPRAAAALRAAAAHALERSAYAESRDLLNHALRLAENLADAARKPVEEQIRAELAAPCELLLNGAGRSSQSSEKFDEFWMGT